MKRLLLCLLILCVVASSFSVWASPKTLSSNNEGDDFFKDILKNSTDKNSYDSFLINEAYESAVGEKIILSSAAAVKTENEMKWQFNADGSGRYYLKAVYNVAGDGLSSPEATIMVNGVVPYSELAGFEFPVEYMDATKPETDIYGNQIAPSQVVSGKEVSTYIFDYTGSYAQPLSVNVNDGTNELKITYSDEEISLSSLILVPVDTLKDYLEYQKIYKEKSVYNGQNIKVEGESAVLKSDSVLSASGDRSSPLVSPVKTGKILLNTIGGYNWKSANQYIRWNVVVPEDGLYTLSLKARQNRSVGQPVYRALYINGEIPFKEAAQIRVDYSSKWQMKTLSNESGEYLFYLNKGENEIMLSATLGEFDTVVRMMDNAVVELNSIYRQLLVLLGSEPDLSKDYKLEKIVPELIKNLGAQADKLEVISDTYEKLNGGKNALTATLQTLVRQLRKMSGDADKIPSEFSYFKTNIGSLGTNLALAKEQPLEVDYFILASESPTLPKYKAGFFAQLIFDIKEFACSFVIDYKNIGTVDKNSSGTMITAWISSGRDQAQIIRGLVSDDFIPNTGHKVKLELVSGASLLPATVAGKGPDVYIGASDVVNFAMRNAAYNLKKFDDFDDISKRFLPATFVVLKYLDGVYALPNQMGFNVLYYRTDILADLGLEVPQTWDDIIAMSSVLAVNNMSFGLPASSEIYLMMVKQKGLDVYRQNGAVCALDDPAAIELFQYYTNFYNNYGFPLSYSLVNRFRTGEIPIAIDNISLYNSLEISAPEIKGLWKFSMVPGFKDGDGNIRRDSLTSGAATMMLESTKHPDESWEFMKWWTSATIQSKYGREIESVLGASARYSSANIDAFEQSLWSKAERSVLIDQMQYLNDVEVVPGSYYLGRNLNNAFRNVVYYDKKTIDVMFDYVYKINGELTEKRVELGLETAKEDR